MRINWDSIIGFLIIVGLILSMWAKMGGQTIKELIEDITSYFKEKKEEGVEYAVEI